MTGYLTRGRSRRLVPLGVLIVVLMSACSAPPQRGDPTVAADAAHAFLQSLTQGRVAQAWSVLTPDSRAAAYDNDAEAFADDVRSADWADFTWRIGPVTDLEISWGVHVESEPEQIPTFLIDRGIAGGWDDQGMLLLVQIASEEQFLIAAQGMDTRLP